MNKMLFLENHFENAEIILEDESNFKIANEIQKYFLNENAPLEAQIRSKSDIAFFVSNSGSSTAIKNRRAPYYQRDSSITFLNKVVHIIKNFRTKFYWSVVGGRGNKIEHVV